MPTIEQEGTYRARATEAQLFEANSGTPGINIVFVVTDGPEKGAHVRYTGWMSDRAYERTLESLESCGWKGEDPSELNDGLHGLDKNEVELVVEMEPYEGNDERHVGKSFARVKWVNRIGGLRVENAMPKDKAKVFGAQMAERIRAARLARTKGGSGTDFPHGANAPATGTGGKKF